MTYLSVWFRPLAFIITAAFICAAGALAQDVPNRQPLAPSSNAPPPSRSFENNQSSSPSSATPIITAGSLGGHSGPDLSPWAMFLNADILIKGVMLGLMGASLATWTVFAAKSIEIVVARRILGKALVRIERAKSLPEAKIAAGTGAGLLPRLVGAAAEELELSGAAASRAGIKERAESRFGDLIRAETQAMRRGMGLLATIGSTAPFIGLFGTVWGIMNSFIGISKAQTTNLAVVAPGIAEALLATATGLVAAIPAVIIYNHFARATRNYQTLTARAANVTGRLLSRELDRERTGKTTCILAE